MRILIALPWRRWAAVLLLAAAPGWLPAAPAAAQAGPLPMPDVRVYLDGALIAFDTAPLNVAGRLLVPVRPIFEALGARVIWDGVTMSVQATRGSTVIQLRIGDGIARVDGQPVQLDVPPQIYGRRTLVPLRYVSEALGARVVWDGPSRTVRLTRSGEPGPAHGAGALPPGDGMPGPAGPDPAALWRLALERNSHLDLQGQAVLEVTGGGGPPLIRYETVDLRVRGQDFHLVQRQGAVVPAGGPSAETETGLAARAERQYHLVNGAWQPLIGAPPPTGLALAGLPQLPVPGLTPPGQPAAFAGLHAGGGRDGLWELRLPVPVEQMVSSWIRWLPAGVSVRGPVTVREAEAGYWLDAADGTLREMEIRVALAVPLQGTGQPAEPLELRIAARMTAAPGVDPLPAHPSGMVK